MRKILIHAFILLATLQVQATEAADSAINNQLEIVAIELFAQVGKKREELAFKVTDAKLEQKDVRGSINVRINGENFLTYVERGKGFLLYDNIEPGFLYFEVPSKRPAYALFHWKKVGHDLKIKTIPLWVSMLPPLFAILLALIFREVILSLFAGIWFGAFVIYGMSFESIFTGLLKSLEVYVINALDDSGHLSIIVFSLLIGGMVAVISKNGGMNGVVKLLSPLANSARNSQLVTWLLGLAIFFDDYANTLVVGNTMRSVTDKFRVSREKLAYIVDSTAAPVAAIAFVTTWIGAELGYIEDALASFDLELSSYGIFFNSLKYAYYPVLTLFFILLLVWNQKDFGPMLKIELETRKSGVVPPEGVGGENPLGSDKEGAWYNAVVPILTLIITVIVGLFATGYDEIVWNGNDSFFNKISSTIGNADSYIALLWGSIAGVSVAVLMSATTGGTSLVETMENLQAGIKTMLGAILILTLAWALAGVTESLHTADFLVGIIPASFEPSWFPLIIFVLAALISFATGSSWGTMAILYPIALPLTLVQAETTGMSPEWTYAILFNVTSVVLSGSVLGDHCSPISDTTILSSLASGCDHIQHVRTQLPYAITVGSISILVGGLFFAFGLPWWLNYLIGAALVILAVRLLGKDVPDFKMDSQSPG